MRKTRKFFTESKALEFLKTLDWKQNGVWGRTSLSNLKGKDKPYWVTYTPKKYTKNSA